MSITHVRDIDIQMMLFLSDSDLKNLCQINSFFRQICRNDHFWKLKVETSYPEYKNKKPTDQTWKQWYLGFPKIIKIKPIGYGLVKEIPDIYKGKVKIGDILIYDRGSIWIVGPNKNYTYFESDKLVLYFSAIYYHSQYGHEWHVTNKPILEKKIRQGYDYKELLRPMQHLIRLYKFPFPSQNIESQSKF